MNAFFVSDKHTEVLKTSWSLRNRSRKTISLAPKKMEGLSLAQYTSRGIHLGAFTKLFISISPGLLLPAVHYATLFRDAYFVGTANGTCSYVSRRRSQRRSLSLIIFMFNSGLSRSRKFKTVWQTLHGITPPNRPSDALSETAHHVFNISAHFNFMNENI